MNGGKGEEGAEPHSTRGRIIAIHTSQNAGWKSSSQSKSVLTSMRLRGILLCLPEIRVFFGLGAVIAKFQGRIDCYHMRSRSLSQIPRGVSNLRVKYFTHNYVCETDPMTYNPLRAYQAVQGNLLFQIWP